MLESAAASQSRLQLEPQGYQSEAYARSLVHLGTAQPLTRSGGWLIQRPLAAGAQLDLCAPYPLLTVADGAQLASDLEQLPSGPVTVTAVVDPLQKISPKELAQAFPDHLLPFKQHYLVDLALPIARTASKHHQRNQRRAEAELCLAPCDLDDAALADWIELYAQLVDRHGIQGPAAFPAESFRRLWSTPGLLGLRASRKGKTVGMQLWMRHGERAWYHLAATSPEGYALRAAHGLMGCALEHLRRGGVQVALLGGGAGGGYGSRQAPEDCGELGELDGLSRFKAGWSTHTRPAMLGGRILDREAHAALCQARGPAGGSNWFPLYRRP